MPGDESRIESSRLSATDVGDLDGSAESDSGPAAQFDPLDRWCFKEFAAFQIEANSFTLK
jgi:hypothetical protein